MKFLHNQSGVALMLVLAALVVLTTMAAEFAFNTNVSYHMAMSERDRLKAQYLALSSYRFMLVELKFDKVFRSVIEKQNLGQIVGGSANMPLCQQFPISTALIKAVFLGGAEGEDAEEGAGAVGMLPEEFSKLVSIEQREEAGKFLDFEGDFEGECIDESSRVNLNAFAIWKPDNVIEGKLNEYDQFKEFLVKFLSDQAFEDLFEKADVKPADVVRNIADWVDTNERINESGGIMGAPEDTLYERKGLTYPLKNGKFTTPDEVYLVEGVVDDWFYPLQNRFTIYGDGKVDVCNAPSDVVAALIRRYVEGLPDAPVIDYTDGELMDKLVTAVMDGCSLGGTGEQLKKNVSDVLDMALKELTGAVYESAVEGGGAGGVKGFGEFIATERRFISLILSGLVGDVAVTIFTTLDIGDNDPKRWKILYWKVY